MARLQPWTCPATKYAPRSRDFEEQCCPFRLGEELSADVAQLARRVGATSNMVVLAAYATVLWRWSSQDDIVIGTPMVLRDAPDLERIVGYFINPLAMRCQVSGEESFGALLERVRSTVLRAYDHKEVPFDVVVSDAEVTPGSGPFSAIPNESVLRPPAAAGLGVARHHGDSSADTHRSLSLRS